MPKRKVVLANKEIYHIFNKTIGNEIAFSYKKYNDRALELLDYYRFLQFKRYSHFIALSKEDKEKYISGIKKTTPLVEIYAFALMPNHFHLLVKQIRDNGITKFLANFQNSFAKYFNLKSKRSGSLFQHMFKAKRVEDDDQLIHLSRYIHLNPVTSFMIKIGELSGYPWTSFSLYLEENSSDLISSDLLLGFFKSKKKYKKFVFDQADYQRKLQKIKHLLK